MPKPFCNLGIKFGPGPNNICSVQTLAVQEISALTQQITESSLQEVPPSQPNSSVSQS